MKLTVMLKGFAYHLRLMIGSFGLYFALWWVNAKWDVHIQINTLTVKLDDGKWHKIWICNYNKIDFGL